jgi:hypothetical protein
MSDMWCCDGRTFVLQRRINRPFSRILRVISNPEIFGPGSVLASDDEGALRLDTRFHPGTLFSVPTLHAHATLQKQRRREIGVELEVGPWAQSYDTELLLRPQTRHPQRWSSAMMRRYFAHAHRGADALTLLLDYAVIVDESLGAFR